MPSAYAHYITSRGAVYEADTEPGYEPMPTDAIYIARGQMHVVDLLELPIETAGDTPIEGTATIVLDDVTVTVTGSVKNRGVASVLLDDMVVTAVGDASPGVVGNADIVLDPMVVSATASLNVRGAAAIVLDDVVVAALGHNGADSPPLTNAQMQELHLWIFELRKIHGLQPGMPLMVGTTSRVAGDITQTVAEGGGSVTVTRV